MKTRGVIRFHDKPFLAKFFVLNTDGVVLTSTATCFHTSFVRHYGLYEEDVDWVELVLKASSDATTDGKPRALHRWANALVFGGLHDMS